MKVTFEYSARETARVKTFYFRPQLPFSYRPGQYVRLTLPHEKPDERGVSRWLTLSSSPAEQLLGVTVKFSADRSSTYKHALAALRKGTVLSISRPAGRFVLPRHHGVPLVFVAGGVGIAPFRSMLSWILAKNEPRQTQLIYGVDTEEDLVFKTLLPQIQPTPIVVVSHPSEGWRGRTGRITADLVHRFVRARENTRVYVSGPEAMIADLRSQFVARGIERRRILVDQIPRTFQGDD